MHGVYAPGNVRLHPELLGKHQAFVSEKLGGSDKKPGKHMDPSGAEYVMADGASLLRVPRRFRLQQAGVP